MYKDLQMRNQQFVNINITHEHTFIFCKLGLRISGLQIVNKYLF